MAPKPPPFPSSSSTSESDSSATSSDEEVQYEMTKANPPLKKPVPNTGNRLAANDDSGSEEDDEGDEEENEDASDDSDSPPKPAKPAPAPAPAPAPKSKVSASAPSSPKPAKPAPAPAPAPKSKVSASAGKAPPVVSKSESDESDSDDNPSPPIRPSGGSTPSVKAGSKPADGTPKGKKPSSEKPKPSAASAPGAEKRKREEAEDEDAAGKGEGVAAAAANGSSVAKGEKKGGQKSRARPGTASPSKRRSRSAVAKPLVTDGDHAGEKAAAVYPNLGEAMRLLEEEDRSSLLKGPVIGALGLLAPDEAKGLEDRWNTHFIEGFKYFRERAALKEDLLKSLIDALERE